MLEPLSEVAFAAPVSKRESVPESTAAVPAFEVVAYGLPAPQGSKRHVGNGRMVESSIHVAPWREAVVWAAVHKRRKVKGWCPLDGPLAAEMVFTFARPKGHFGTGRNAGVIKTSAPLRPSSYPDLSKLARSTEDALTTASIYADDSLIVEYRALAKFYATDHGTVPDVLDGPGCTVRLWPIERPEVDG